MVGWRHKSTHFIFSIMRSSGQVHSPTALPRDKNICYTSILSVALQSLSWVLAFFRRRLQFSLASARLYHPRIPGYWDVSLRTTSSLLVLGFPHWSCIMKFPTKNLISGIVSFPSLIIWPAHYTLLISISSTTFTFLYKLGMPIFPFILMGRKIFATRKFSEFWGEEEFSFCRESNGNISVA
jgi:hypothetical protein